MSDELLYYLAHFPKGVLFLTSYIMQDHSLLSIVGIFIIQGSKTIRFWCVGHLNGTFSGNHFGLF